MTRRQLLTRMQALAADPRENMDIEIVVEVLNRVSDARTRSGYRTEYTLAQLNFASGGSYTLLDGRKVATLSASIED